MNFFLFMLKILFLIIVFSNYFFKQFESLIKNVEIKISIFFLIQMFRKSTFVLKMTIDKLLRSIFVYKK